MQPSFAQRNAHAEDWGRNKKTLPKAQRTRGLSSTYQSNFFGLYPGTSESGFLKFEKWKVKIKSFHSFSRSAKWKKMASLFFEKCKVKSKCFHSFSRSEKWNQNASRSRSRSENSREFLTILEKRDFLTDEFRESRIKLLNRWLVRGVLIMSIWFPRQ